MSCRHSPGDPECSSTPQHIKDATLLLRSTMSQWTPATREAIIDLAKNGVDTPDSMKFEYVKVEEVNGHLVVMALYPNCSKCAYEGHKVMVFLNTSMKDALNWRKIDPHFRNPNDPCIKSVAPSPSARFPASPDGWMDALEYAREKPAKNR